MRTLNTIGSTRLLVWGPEPQWHRFAPGGLPGLSLRSGFQTETMTSARQRLTTPQHETKLPSRVNVLSLSMALSRRVMPGRVGQHWPTSTDEFS